MTRRLSRRALPTLDSFRRRAPALASWPNEKKKFDWNPRVTLAPFILETTGRPGDPAQKFIKGLDSETPTATSGPPSRPPSTTVFPNNSSEPSRCDPWRLFLTTTHALHHRCLAVTGCSHVLTLLTGFRHGGVAPADAIATWLLHWRQPGGATRPYLVTFGVCAAPASAEITNSSGVQKCGSPARAAPKRARISTHLPNSIKHTGPLH